MERLSIDEVIEHCKRHVEKMESHSGRMQLEETPVGNSNIMKQYWEHRQVAEWLEQLKIYKKADEQGLLLRLPCKVGDMVYIPKNYLDCEYDYNCPLGYAEGKGICERGLLCEHEHRKFFISEVVFDVKLLNDISKTVFLTKEEAEAALEKMKGEEHE